MSKLPAEFVKAPATQPKPRTRRPSKASLISPDPMRDPRELHLHLTDEEYQALEEARQQLHQAGSEVTLEQMIHRVFADWMLRARAAVQAPSAHAETAAPTSIETAAPASTENTAPASTENAAPASTQTGAPRDERMIVRLRAFVAGPLRMWRELATQMWRTAYLRRS